MNFQYYTFYIIEKKKKNIGSGFQKIPIQRKNVNNIHSDLWRARYSAELPKNLYSKILTNSSDCGDQNTQIVLEVLELIHKVYSELRITGPG